MKDNDEWWILEGEGIVIEEMPQGCFIHSKDDFKKVIGG
jgi:hypothetical protein